MFKTVLKMMDFVQSDIVLSTQVIAIWIRNARAHFYPFHNAVSAVVRTMDVR